MLLREEEEGKRSGAAAVKLEGEASPLDDVEVKVCNQVGSGTGISPFFASIDLLSFSFLSAAYYFAKAWVARYNDNFSISSLIIQTPLTTLPF